MRCMKGYVQVLLIVLGCRIKNDDLRQFHAKHPRVTLTTPVYVPCMCGCNTKMTALDGLLPATVSKYFRDTLYGWNTLQQ